MHCTQGFKDIAASYHPIGSYRFIHGQKLIGLPSDDDAVHSPMGTVAAEAEIVKLLELRNTILRTAGGGWCANLASSCAKL